jgi:hypothetical protein
MDRKSGKVAVIPVENSTGSNPEYEKEQRKNA